VQLHVHLKKWSLKFKPLYLRNYASYFNKICRISCVNTHIKSLKVWLKSIVPLLKYSIFSMGLFLLAHPVGSWVAEWLRCWIQIGLWFRGNSADICTGCTNKKQSPPKNAVFQPLQYGFEPTSDFVWEYSHNISCEFYGNNLYISSDTAV